MNENRETLKFKTPIGNKEIEIKAWLTGQEQRTIRNPFFENASFGITGIEKFQFSSELINKAQDLAFEIVVVSIDGTKDNIIQRILDMRAEDFDFIVKKINEITSGKIEEEAKKK